MNTNQAGQILIDILDFPVLPRAAEAKGPKEVVNSNKKKVTLKPKECRCFLAQMKTFENSDRSQLHFAELFSPPRFTAEIERRGGKGRAYDLKLGGDLTDPVVQKRVP